LDDDGDELDDDDDDFADASLYAVLPLEELCTLLRGDPDAHVDCDALAQVALETSRREGSRKTVGILDGFIDALRDRAQSDSARKLLADAYFALGEVHHQAGEIAHAIAAFKQAARTRCDFAEAHGRIAALYFDNDDVKSALEAWRTQIALTPDDPEPYFASAVALEGMGRPDRAAEVLTSLLLHDPENASALDALVRLAEEGGRFAEAESCRERILAMGPPRLLEDMAVWAKYQVEAGNFDGVLDHLHREELDAPSLSFLNLLKAIVFLTREDPDNVEVELMLVRDKVGGSAAALEPALQSLERVFGSPRLEPLRRAIAEHVASPGA
jgi:tetratricopeptide (TPR) repeat protein